MANHAESTMTKLAAHAEPLAVLLEPLAPSDVVRVTQDLPYIKCSSTNNGTALCVEFHMQKGDL